MPRNSEEYKIHCASVEHIHSSFIPANMDIGLKCWHIPNQTRSKTEAFHNKRLGAIPGMFDLNFGWGERQMGIIEIKSSKGKLSPEQKDHRDWALNRGWKTGEARTVREVHSVLVLWGMKYIHQVIREPDIRTHDQKVKDAFNFYRPL